VQRLAACTWSGAYRWKRLRRSSAQPLIIGPWLRRLPDGETRERSNWIGSQAGRFTDPALFEEVPPQPGAYVQRPTYRPRFDALTEDVCPTPLGYAAAALASYVTFARLRNEGVISSAVRFQVCLPTPIAPVVVYIIPDAQERFEQSYARQLMQELTDRGWHSR